jgi:hypothetical protein
MPAASALNIVSQTDKDKKAYALNLSNWGLVAPNTPTIDSVIKISDGTNVKTTVMPTGSPSFSGTTLTLPLLQLLTLGEQYRVRVLFIDSGNTWEANFTVDCRID